MTTIVVNKNKIAVDKRIHIDHPSGPLYYKDGVSKVFYSKCGRGAFLFLFENIEDKSLDLVMDAFLNAIVLMKQKNTYPAIMLDNNICEAIGTKISVYICIKDEMYWFGRIHDMKLNSGGTTQMFLVKIDPEIFLSYGSGEHFANGIHAADPTIPLGEIVERVSLLNFSSGREYDLVDCSKLKPLYKEVVVKKPANRRKKKC